MYTIQCSASICDGFLVLLLLLDSDGTSFYAGLISIYMVGNFQQTGRGVFLVLIPAHISISLKAEYDNI